MGLVDGLLFDIDGVLVVSWEPIEGAPEVLAELRARDVPLRFVTNTTTRTRAEIAEAMIRAGFVVEPDEILTAPVATAAYLRRHHAGSRCHLLSSGDVSADLEGIHLVVHGDPADVFVIGGAGMVFTHSELNQAFRLLLDGADFVAMHRNLYWRTADGLELDTGAYVRVLEEATGTTPIVLGKPSTQFFESGLEALGLPAPRVAMVGDDIENDVLGAQRAGLYGVLVRTGKYRADAVEAASGVPDRVVDSLADVLDLV